MKAFLLVDNMGQVVSFSLDLHKNIKFYVKLRKNTFAIDEEKVVKKFRSVR